MNDRVPARPRWPAVAGVASMLGLLTVLAYGRAATQDRFVTWDDVSLIYANSAVGEFTPHTIYQAWTSFDPELYAPLTTTGYQLDHLLGGLNPAVYHWHNLLLHVANALLVWMIVWLLFSTTAPGQGAPVMDAFDSPQGSGLSAREWIAFLGAVIFAIHPLNTEAVLWASARKDVQSGFFFLLSIVCYLQCTRRSEPAYRTGRHVLRSAGRSARWYFLSLLSFLLGLFSKVSILTLPFVLLLVDLWRRRRMDWPALLEKIPFVALSIGFGIVALVGKPQLSSTTVVQKILIAGKSTVFYLRAFLFPLHLSLLYPYTQPIGLSSPDLLASSIGVLLLLGLIAWTWKRSREVAIGFLIFLATLVPSFFNITRDKGVSFASDRYAYLPLVGLVLAVAYLLHRLLSALRGRARTGTCLAGSLGILAALLPLTFAQATVWQDSEHLFRHAVEEYPESISAQLNLGVVQRESGEFAAAMESFQRVRALGDIPAVHINIARLYERQGRDREARTAYEHALSLDAANAEALTGLGEIALRTGAPDDAAQFYRRALTANPYYVSAANDLATIEVRRGEFDAAERHLRKALDLEPTLADAHFNLALVLREQRRLDEALAEAERAMTLEPANADAIALTAGILLEAGEGSRADALLARALAIDPGNRLALSLEAARGSGHRNTSGGARK